MDALPSGWDIATIQSLSGSSGLMTDGDWIESKDQDPSGDVRLIQLADIGDGYFVNKSSRFLTMKRAKELNCTFLKPGDVLIARMPDPLGRACIFPDIGQPAVTAVDICIWRGNDEIERKWLVNSINSPEVRENLLSMAAGSTRQRVSGGNLKKYQIPVPPTREQKRIADKLDNLFSRSRAAREELTYIARLIERYKQAILSAAVSGELTFDWRNKNGLSFDDWGEKSGEKVFPFITSGSRGWAQYYSNTGSIFLRVGNLDHQTIKLDLEAIQYVNPPEGAEGRRTRVEVGDILISITADVGMVALIDSDIGEAYINQHLCLARQTGEFFAPYLAYYLASPIGGLSQLTNAQRGATKAGLTLGDIRNLRIKIPPFEEQKEIVRCIGKAFSAIDAITTQTAAAQHQISHLEAQCLNKAFRGELVPQDANDESASALLKRLQTEAVPAKSKRRGRKAKG